MAKTLPTSVKETVYKLQHYLLDGIQTERQLLAAGSIISRSDYEDVVTERTIANLCGYPLCSNHLPSERPRKGRYRISLKEHKVYDLQETYTFCSTSCVVNSRTFAGSLQEERCSDLDPSKLYGVLRLFGDVSPHDRKGDLGKNLDLGLSNLKILDNAEVKAGEVSLEEWLGPSDAIEGYVPRTDKSRTHSHSKNHRKEVTGANATCSKPSSKAEVFSFGEMDFSSTIIMNDEYSIWKAPPSSTENVSYSKLEAPEGQRILKEFQDLRLDSSYASMRKDSGGAATESTENVKVIKEGKADVSELSSMTAYQSCSDMNAAKAEMDPHVEIGARSSEASLKPSLKSSGTKKLNRSVTWADETVDSTGSGNLCEVKEIRDTKVVSGIHDCLEGGDEDNRLRLESAEACATVLSEAAEAVAYGDSEVDDAVSDAGIIILPRPHDVVKGERSEGATNLESDPLSETAPLKWSNEPGVPQSDIFDPDNSWLDDPPEGFSLTLSTFATMWNALFEWITSSSLAYVYGVDDSFHEEYLLINGREYPQKVVMHDGRSSEIKETLAGCVSRVLPGLVSDLQISVPLSILEQGMGQLLDTMTFVNALPAFKVKQWRAMILLFMEAISVCRFPALVPYMTDRRMLLHKVVLDPSQISVEEYDIMKDMLIPLGRAPHFSSQSGA